MSGRDEWMGFVAALVLVGGVETGVGGGGEGKCRKTVYALGFLGFGKVTSFKRVA